MSLTHTSLRASTVNCRSSRLGETGTDPCIRTAELGPAIVGFQNGTINDPKYPEEIWAKMSYERVLSDGSRVEIHYWENLKTGLREGFKFK